MIGGMSNKPKPPTTTNIRYDVTFPKELPPPSYESEAKTVWIKIGAAFPRESGAISLNIDAMPLRFDGRLMLFPHDVAAGAREGAADARAARAKPSEQAERIRTSVMRTVVQELEVADRSETDADSRESDDWAELIETEIRLLRKTGNRHHLVTIAALAMAGLESSIRKNGE